LFGKRRFSASPTDRRPERPARQPASLFMGQALVERFLNSNHIDVLQDEVRG
jgi:hypothetical protein